MHLGGSRSRGRSVDLGTTRRACGTNRKAVDLARVSLTAALSEQRRTKVGSCIPCQRQGMYSAFCYADIMIAFRLHFDPIGDSENGSPSHAFTARYAKCHYKKLSYHAQAEMLHEVVRGRLHIASRAPEPGDCGSSSLAGSRHLASVTFMAATLFCNANFLLLAN